MPLRQRNGAARVAEGGVDAALGRQKQALGGVILGVRQHRANDAQDAGEEISQEAAEEKPLDSLSVQVYESKKLHDEWPSSASTKGTSASDGTTRLTPPMARSFRVRNMRFLERQPARTPRRVRRRRAKGDAIEAAHFVFPATNASRRTARIFGSAVLSATAARRASSPSSAS